MPILAVKFSKTSVLHLCHAQRQNGTITKHWDTLETNPAARWMEEFERGVLIRFG
jgi:hypothetical protein